MNQKVQAEDDLEFDLESYNKAQIEEALGPENKYFAYLKLKREPTDQEAFWHWLQNGGPENFSKQHKHKFFKKRE